MDKIGYAIQMASAAMGQAEEARLEAQGLRRESRALQGVLQAQFEAQAAMLGGMVTRFTDSVKRQETANAALRSIIESVASETARAHSRIDANVEAIGLNSSRLDAHGDRLDALEAPWSVKRLAMLVAAIVLASGLLIGIGYGMGVLHHLAEQADRD